MYMFGVVGTHTHDYFEVILFYNRIRYIYTSNDTLEKLLYYVICVICISKKLKYLKNEARESKTETQLTLLF